MSRLQRIAARATSVLLAVIVLTPTTAAAQSRGMQITPDSQRILVNKDIGSERWAITQNQDDQTVTGNVFQSGGGSPSFIFCEPNGGALRCSGTSACSNAFGQRGIQNTPDGKRILVNKDVGTERWAISRNESDGTVTGNVFQSGGGAPSFIFCQPLGPANSYRCSGANACTSTPCANTFAFIADVTLPADFFSVPVPCNEQYVLLDDTVVVPEGFFSPPNDTRALTNDIEDAATAILDIGIGIFGAGTSSLAQSSLVEGSVEAATFACTEGGFYDDDGFRIEAFDCQENGVILNGTAPYSFDFETGELFVTLNQVSVFDLGTGEQSFWTGTLSFVNDGNLYVTNGSVGVSSNQLGSYEVSFFEFTVDSNDVTVSGGFEVNVRQGAGAFAGISAIRFETIPPHSIDRVEIDVIGNDTAVYYFAFTLCDPCTSSDTCADGLLCFPCHDQCTGDTARCSVDIAGVFLDCADGFF
jgi:hypothetical protein